LLSVLSLLFAITGVALQVYVGILQVIFYEPDYFWSFVVFIGLPVLVMLSVIVLISMVASLVKHRNSPFSFRSMLILFSSIAIVLTVLKFLISDDWYYIEYLWLYDIIGAVLLLFSFIAVLRLHFILRVFGKV